MANKLYSETAIQNIASSIRNKNGTQNTYTVSQMAQAILDIQTESVFPLNNGANNFYIEINQVSDSNDYNPYVQFIDLANSYTYKYYAGSGVYSDYTNKRVVVSWGDGDTVEYTESTLPTTDIYHYYKTAGEYIVSITTYGTKIEGVSTVEEAIPTCFKHIPIIDTSVNNQPNKLTMVELNSIVQAQWSDTYPNKIYLDNIFQNENASTLNADATQITFLQLPENLYIDTTNITSTRFDNFTSLATVNMGLRTDSNYSSTFPLPNTVTKVKILGTPTKIPNKFFYNKQYIEEYDLPTSITTIGRQAFYDNHALTSFDFSNIKEYGVEAFSGTSSIGCGLTTITLPDISVDFKTESGSSPKTHTFRNNHNLTTLNINCDIPTTAQLVFSKCDSLQTVTVGANVTALGDGIFQENNAQFHYWTIHCLGTTPPALGTQKLGSENRFYAPSVIYVPASAVETYQNDTNWSTYASVIQAEPAGE